MSALIPEGWTKVVAADAFSLIATTDKKVKTKECLTFGNFPVIDQGQGHIAGYINDKSKVITVDEPLIVFGDHTRAVKWIDFNFVPGADGTKILQSQSFIDSRLAYHQLCSLEIPDKGYSRHFKFFKELSFVIPPLAEQKVIADKLDELLAQVESTKARLDAIPAILKSFRQSVLAAAVSGKLTEEWRGENTSQLMSIDNVCHTGFDGPFGSKLKTADYTDNGVRVARLENVGHLNFIEEKQTFISENKHKELTRNTLEENDILFSSFVEEEVRVCLFPKHHSTFINKADCFCLRVNNDIALPKFVVYVLASRSSYEQIKSNVQGVTRPRINLKILKSLTFRFPTLKEQTEIVRRVEELFAFADKVEAQVNEAQTRVNNLTQSILAKAFRGELTADWRTANPELIRGENSAESLLKRIKAERAAMGKKSKQAKV
ncbi:restriction endonuclease subunit S [Shewanella baltica]|uniref:restriction endonuclease subunit S n=1 Tax=Shewanella baltica TaxID=62322 RepID=UPI00216957AD|nr:restriction endonuclease subunit S [Shewanella baltica]MCS6114269.1 specificity determinant for hsdM and hsdR [Shewanella baltica]UVW65696.1 specificity determinant for hsdM and hsdR [Shewanella baltica]